MVGHNRKDNVEDEDDEEEQGDNEDDDVDSVDEVQDEKTLHDPSTRRKLRLKYRELIISTQEQKSELIRPEAAEGLLDVLKSGDLLFKQVSETREGAMDAEFLANITQIGLEQTRRIKTSFKSYDVSDFIHNVKRQMTPKNKGEGEDEGEQKEAYDWKTLGTQASSLFQTTPSVQFMYGPLNAEPIAKKVREKKVRTKEDKAELTRGTTISNPQADQGAETTSRVSEVHTHLSARKTVDFYQFIFNRESFSQTVENLFHTAFLVKEGHARTTDQQTQGGEQIPTVSVAEAPDEADYSSKRAKKKQCVVKFDMRMFETLKERYPGKHPMIPTRHVDPSLYVHPSLAPSNNHHHHNKRRRQSSSSDEEDASLVADSQPSPPPRRR